MKFPERVLRIKAENATEHDRWYEAVKDARQKKLDGNNTPQAKQLETLKASQFLHPHVLCGSRDSLVISSQNFLLPPPPIHTLCKFQPAHGVATTPLPLRNTPSSRF